MPNLQENLRYLKSVQVKRGQDPREVASSKTMNAIIQVLHGLAGGENFSRGVGTLMRRTDTSVTISASPKRFGAVGQKLKMAFTLSNATTVGDGGPLYKVKIFDGQINDEFPIDMGGDNGDYILPPDEGVGFDLTAGGPITLIFAEITFDPNTLEIFDNDDTEHGPGRDLGYETEDDFPDDEIVMDGSEGTFYVVIGIVYLDDQGNFQIEQSRLGDINFELVYQTTSAAAGVIALTQESAFMPLPEPEE